MIAWLLALAWAEPELAAPVASDPAAVGLGVADEVPEASAPAEPWRLVAAYDPSAIAALDGSEPAYTWPRKPPLAETCGPAKSPDGLGVFEAEAVANGLTPTLALVLERRLPPGAAAPRLTTRDLRLSIGLPDGGEADGRILLQPMIEPRDLAVRIDAPGPLRRYGQLVRTQVEVETCLEHKVGRGWTGQSTERVRQAFLLTPPRTRLASRKYFGGQRDPVPALLGPPDACLDGVDAGLRAKDGRGEGSLTLVPTDVWGASLRPCDAVMIRGGEIAGDDTLVPLSVTMQGVARRRPRTWQRLVVELSSAREVPEDPDVRVRVTLAGSGDRPSECLHDGPLFEATGESASLEDVLATVPQRYPVLVDGGVARAVLLVPGWQVVEALRQLGATPGGPGAGADANAVDALRGAVADLPPTAVQDAVAFVLAHPEHLFLQLRPDLDDPPPPPETCPGRPGETAPPDDGAERPPWPNLAGVMWSRSLGQPWGYTVGLLDGRSAIVLPRREAPSWAQTIRAQRGLEQAALLVSLFLVVGVGLLAIRRIPDLWARIPSERAWYWPGKARAVPAEAELGEQLPDAEVE